MLDIDAKVLRDKAKDNGSIAILANTLIRLTFSQQNIPHLNADEKFVAMHKRLNALTEGVIGDEPEQEELLEEYRYNRIGYFVKLQMLEGESFLGRISETAYIFNKYLRLRERYLSKKGEFFKGKISQISNMLALSLIQGPCDQEVYLEAEEFFNEAFTLRSAILKRHQESPEFKSSQIKTYAHKTNEFLLANIRTGYIDCLVNLKPLNKELIQLHKDALEKYLLVLDETRDYNSYRSSYIHAIELANQNLK